MAFDEGAPRSGGASSKWVDDKTRNKRFSRVLSRQGWSDFVFAFHDREEIGPRMLSRISKLTGLKREDL